MLIWTARISKKTKAVVAVILAGILLAAVILLAGRSGAGGTASEWRLATNTDRVAYLESLGWQVEEEPVETLPSSITISQVGFPSSPITILEANPSPSIYS